MRLTYNYYKVIKKHTIITMVLQEDALFLFFFFPPKIVNFCLLVVGITVSVFEHEFCGIILTSICSLCISLLQFHFTSEIYPLPTCTSHLLVQGSINYHQLLFCLSVLFCASLILHIINICLSQKIGQWTLFSIPWIII